jgi:hypothetical protein
LEKENVNKREAQPSGTEGGCGIREVGKSRNGRKEGRKEGMRIEDEIMNAGWLVVGRIGTPTKRWAGAGRGRQVFVRPPFGI